MSVIKIEDIAHIRFSAPDLNAMKDFLAAFGLEVEEHDDIYIYGRGRDGFPYNHMTEVGQPAFKALGLRAESVADLERLAVSEGVPVNPLPRPGGGKVVYLVDPDGFQIEVVAGQKKVPVVDKLRETPRNSVHGRSRYSEPLRLEPGPSHVQRLGHCVLNVSDFGRSERWYKERFGFITSDEIEGSPGTAIGAFMRCDRGARPTDHHTLFLAQLSQKPAFMHAAYEVVNIDDLMLGHQHLQRCDYEPTWGVGRHILGSQIFDYWRDPWGHELEHWTDGDLFTNTDVSNKATVADLLDVQWGMPSPFVSEQS